MGKFVAVAEDIGIADRRFAETPLFRQIRAIMGMAGIAAAQIGAVPDVAGEETHAKETAEQAVRLRRDGLVRKDPDHPCRPFDQYTDFYRTACNRKLAGARLETCYGAGRVARAGGHVTMLVSPQISSLIAWCIGGLLIILGLGGALVMLRRGRTGRATLLAVLAMLGLFIGISRQGHGDRVIVVRLAGLTPARMDQRLYGTARYTYSDGRADEITGIDGTVLVNDTPVPLTLQKLSYGLGPSSHQDLPPFHSLSLAGTVDFFGPQDQPPMKITTRYGDWKYWLKW